MSIDIHNWDIASSCYYNSFGCYKHFNFSSLRNVISVNFTNYYNNVDFTVNFRIEEVRLINGLLSYFFRGAMQKRSRVDLVYLILM